MNTQLSGLLAGKAAIVTGGANGIGRGIVSSLRQAGANVLIADKDCQAGQVSARELDAAFEETDVRDPASVESAVAACVRRFGRLDVMVSNAGRTDRQPFLEMEAEFFRELLRLNLEGVFHSGQAAAKQMVRQGGCGAIVNISSNSGRFGGCGRAAYSASKAGIIALTQTMSIELATHNIRVNTVAPGPIKTQRTTTELPGEAFLSRMPIKRFGEPCEIGQAVAFLASDASSFTTGQVLSVDGGLTATGIMEG